MRCPWPECFSVQVGEGVIRVSQTRCPGRGVLLLDTDPRVSRAGCRVHSSPSVGGTSSASADCTTTPVSPPHCCRSTPWSPPYFPPNYCPKPDQEQIECKTAGVRPVEALLTLEKTNSTDLCYWLVILWSGYTLMAGVQDSRGLALLEKEGKRTGS